MKTCPACGYEIGVLPNSSLEMFLCANCKNPLRVTLRLRMLFLSLFAILALSLRAVTIVVNPRPNPSKTSRLPFAMEGVLARLLWRTDPVRIGLDHPSRPAQHAQPN
jgi:hypothetical protein